MDHDSISLPEQSFSAALLSLAALLTTAQCVVRSYYNTQHLRPQMDNAIKQTELLLFEGPKPWGP